MSYKNDCRVKGVAIVFFYGHSSFCGLNKPRIVVNIYFCPINIESQLKFKRMIYPTRKIVFRKIDYDLREVTYYYNDVAPFSFYVRGAVRLPKEVYPYELKIALPLDQSLDFVEKEDAGMANYVRKSIAAFEDKPEPELRAFESLDEEGFDLHQFMRYILSGINVQIEETEVSDDDPPEEKVMVFANIKYDIIDVTYDYDEDKPTVFKLYFELKVPKIYWNEEDNLNIGFTLEQVLMYINKSEISMMQYIQKTVAHFEGQAQPELLAFQFLEEEGFDLKVLAHAVVKGMTVTITKK